VLPSGCAVICSIWSVLNHSFSLNSYLTEKTVLWKLSDLGTFQRRTKATRVWLVFLRIQAKCWDEFQDYKFLLLALLCRLPGLGISKLNPLLRIIELNLRIIRLSISDKSVFRGLFQARLLSFSRYLLSRFHTATRKTSGPSLRTLQQNDTLSPIHTNSCRVSVSFVWF
jgi:hypothetical protein